MCLTKEITEPGETRKLQLSLEEDIAHLLEENTDLVIEVEISDVAGMKDFHKNRRRYSPAIRKLYYQLLLVPTSRIADIL